MQDELERLISEGTLLPGERLNEVALAKRLNVSRGPVREAARALLKTGLVIAVANRGVFVRSLSLDEAAEIYDLNAVLFGFAAAQVASSATVAQMLELRDLVDRMDEAISVTDRDAFFRFNVRFHERILALCQNRQIEYIYLTHAKKLVLLRRQSFTVSSNMAESNAEHRRLVEAILAGDSALARQRGEEHARSGRARFLSTVGRLDGELPAASTADTGRRPSQGRKAGTIRSRMPERTT